MQTEGIAKRYAQALFHLAREKNLLEAFLEELTRVVRITEGEDLLRKLLFAPNVPLEFKKEVLRERASASPFLLNFLYLLLDKRRWRFLGQILSLFQELLQEHHNILEVKVESAVPVSPEQERELSLVMGKKLGKRIHLSVTIDPSLLGGLVLRFQDKVIDGSIRTKLRGLETQLLRMPIEHEMRWLMHLRENRN
ncbi:MAG: ATP synthase F1 subunit delta [Armatimonadetes bacterium]|nr:ATP synthase F1 subunit delta [Armatimonadota bacterium]